MQHTQLNVFMFVGSLTISALKLRRVCLDPVSRFHITSLNKKGVKCFYPVSEIVISVSDILAMFKPTRLDQTFAFPPKQLAIARPCTRIIDFGAVNDSRFPQKRRWKMKSNWLIMFRGMQMADGILTFFCSIEQEDAEGLWQRYLQKKQCYYYILFVFYSRRHGSVPPLRGGACGGSGPHLCGRGLRVLPGQQTCAGEALGAPAPAELLATRKQCPRFSK